MFEDLFHKHKFEVVATTYVPPLNLEGWQASGRELSLQLCKLRAGVTTVLHPLRCPCGAIKKEEMLGEQVRGVVEVKFREVKP